MNEFLNGFFNVPKGLNYNFWDNPDEMKNRLNDIFTTLKTHYNIDVSKIANECIGPRHDFKEIQSLDSYLEMIVKKVSEHILEISSFIFEIEPTEVDEILRSAYISNYHHYVEYLIVNMYHIIMGLNFDKELKYKDFENEFPKLFGNTKKDKDKLVSVSYIKKNVKEYFSNNYLSKLLYPVDGDDGYGYNEAFVEISLAMTVCCKHNVHVPNIDSLASLIEIDKEKWKNVKEEKSSYNNFYTDIFSDLKKIRNSYLKIENPDSEHNKSYYIKKYPELSLHANEYLAHMFFGFEILYYMSTKLNNFSGDNKSKKKMFKRYEKHFHKLIYIPDINRRKQYIDAFTTITNDYHDQINKRKIKCDLLIAIKIFYPVLVLCSLDCIYQLYTDCRANTSSFTDFAFEQLSNAYNILKKQKHLTKFNGNINLTDKYLPYTRKLLRMRRKINSGIYNNDTKYHFNNKITIPNSNILEFIDYE